MSKGPSIQVFEHERMAYKGRYEHPEYDKDLHAAFERYHEKNDQTPFFKLISHGVQFTQYVGAIQIGKYTIEVLPKAGKYGTHEQWQKVLLAMLKKCSGITAKKTSVANLQLKSNSVLELYFELYISAVESLVRRGLIKKYRKQDGQQKALTGSILFSQHITKNLVHKERFYTRHSVYNKDHLLHQILWEALNVIDNISSSSRLKDRIGRIKLSFPEVLPLKVSSAHFDKIEYNRKSQMYIESIEIAKLILLNYRPDLSSGRNDLLAIMFDMNVLWEEYIFRTLKKDLPDYKVLEQRRTSFWEHKVVKPDIVIENKSGDKTFVIDTKWKVIDNKKPADDDLKQMYVYNHHWKASKSLLLYPRANEYQSDTEGMFTLKMNDKPHHCILGFVDVIDSKNLISKDISKRIMEKIDPTIVVKKPD